VDAEPASTGVGKRPSGLGSVLHKERQSLKETAGFRNRPPGNDGAMAEIDREFQKRLSGYLLLAFFSSLLTFSVFIIFQNPDMYLFQKIVEFRGVAPDQYRIVPYLILKGFSNFIDFFSVKFSPLKVAVILFNFFFLSSSYVVLWKSFSNIQEKQFDLFFVLFSFIYPISMFYGFRPVTAFYIFIISCIFFTLNKIKGNKKLFIFFLFFLVFCFSRSDLAEIIWIFTCIYYLKNNKLRIIVILLPIISIFILKYYLFPESVYYTHVFMLKYNLSSNLFILLLSPLTYFFLAIFCLYKEQVSNFFLFALRKYRPLVALIGFYLGLVLVFGNISEFRLWMPYFPLVFFLLDRKLAEKPELVPD